MQQIVENLQSHIDWIGIKRTAVTEDTASQAAPVRMLDYACGSGVASRVRMTFPVELRTGQFKADHDDLGSLSICLGSTRHRCL